MRRTTIFSNSSTFESRPLDVTGYSNRWPGGAGRAPILPEAACLFSCWIAWTTSAGEIRWLAIRSGSSQTRMAYLRPNGFTSLTPGIRLRASTTLICA